MAGSRNDLIFGGVLLAIAAVFVIGTVGFQRGDAQVDGTTGTEETLAEYLQREAAQLGASLPLRTDEVTIWESVTASGNEMTFAYRLEVDVPADQRGAFADTIRPQVVKSVCDDTQVLKILDLGAVVRFTYADAGGSQAARFVFDRQSCGQRTPS